MKLKKWIIENKMQKLAFWIMFNIFYLFTGSYFVTSLQITNRIYAIGFVLLLIMNIIIGIIILCMRKYKISIINYFMGFIIIFGIISTIFAKNSKLALLGTEERCEGLLAIMYYFSIMFLSGFLDKKYFKTVIHFILVTGIVQSIYSVFQAHDFKYVYRKYDVRECDFQNISDVFKVTIDFWATGFESNPNFFGTFMLLCVALVMGLLIEENNNKKIIIYSVVYLILIYGLLLSRATSCILGLGCIGLYSCIYCWKKKRMKLFAIVFVIGCCVLGFATYEKKTTALIDLKVTGKQSVEILKGNSKEKFGTNRIYIWKNTIKIVPNYLMHGVGIDNFIYAFNGTYLKDKIKDVIYDKAHNEYLHILVTEGIFCLISYLIMYGLISIKGIKDSWNNNELYLVLPIIGYLVQAFFNIRVIEVAPVFFIIMGFVINNEKK